MDMSHAKGVGQPCTFHYERSLLLLRENIQCGLVDLVLSHKRKLVVEERWLVVFITSSLLLNSIGCRTRRFVFKAISIATMAEIVPMTALYSTMT